MRLRDQSGFTLPELLMAMTLSLAVLGITLSTFTGFVARDKVARDANDAQDQARTSVDQVARELRNLANPTSAGSSVELATPYDFVFATSDPAKLRVRYCLAGERLWYQTAPVAAPFTASATDPCPSNAGWQTEQVVAEHVVNRAGADRPVFRYGCSRAVPAGGTCTEDDAARSRIRFARVDLAIDVNDTDTRPDAARLSTGVYLRNQNEPPTVSVIGSSAGSRTVALNGSSSHDPEGRTLHYEWFAGGGDPPEPACAGGPAEAGAIGEGVTLTHRFDDALQGPQQIRLRVTDPGCLIALSPPLSVDPVTGSPG